MTHYGSVDRALWARPEVRRLSNNERLLLLYLHTCDRGNMIGVFVCPPLLAAYYTGLDKADVVEALSAPLLPFVSFDAETEEVFVRESARLQVAHTLKQSDNRRTRIERLVDGILSETLRTEFLQEYADWGLGTPSEAPSKPPFEAPPKGAPTETETETEDEGAFEAPSRRVFEYWRSERAEVLKLNGGPKPSFTEKRRSKVQARLREGYTEEELQEAVDGCLGKAYNVENGHVDLELICRDQAHVDRYRTWARKGQAGADGHPSMDELTYLPQSGKDGP